MEFSQQNYPSTTSFSSLSSSRPIRILLLHNDLSHVRDLGAGPIESFLLKEGFDVHEENVSLYELSNPESLDKLLNKETGILFIFKPDLLIGQDKGGNLALEILQRGLWTGPTLLLSPHLEEHINTSLPSTVPIMLIHGSNDNQVPISFAQQFVSKNEDLLGKSFTFNQVPDSHNLESIVSAGEPKTLPTGTIVTTSTQPKLLEFIHSLWEMKEKMIGGATGSRKTTTVTTTTTTTTRPSPTTPGTPAPASVIATPPTTTTTTTTSTTPTPGSPEVSSTIVAADVAGVTVPGTTITSVETLNLDGDKVEVVTAVVAPKHSTSEKSQPKTTATTSPTTTPGSTSGATGTPSSRPATTPGSDSAGSAKKTGKEATETKGKKKGKCMIQ